MISRSRTHLKLSAVMVLLIASVLLIMLCCGCGSSRGILFEQLDQPVVWPEPPEQPRIKYVGQLTGEEDLRKEVSATAAWGRLFFGRDDVGVLSSPRGLALDNHQRLFIADSSGQVVHMMDLETRKYAQFSDLDDDKKLLSPIGLAVVGEDIYVADSALAKICVFSAEGEYKFSFGDQILQRPSGIAWSNTRQELYVADTRRHVVSVFDRQGRHHVDIGGRGTGRGRFNFPTFLWVGKDGKLYVSDTLNYRIQVFGPDGDFLLQFGRHGNRPGHFAHPCGLATDTFGNIYVTDKQFENIQIFNSKGQILMALGGEGRGPGEFWLPMGIFIDENNRIFVADSFNKRIQVLRLLEVQTP